MSEVMLSPRQREIVEHGDGPILVEAGPGSGKTRVLTERVRRLLTQVPGHFRVLALTFTNKAAKEMEDRLIDLAEARQRAFLGTLHGFCLDMLATRGKPIDVMSQPQIFEHHGDRRQILLEAIERDPSLSYELAQAGDARERAKRLDEWLKAIGYHKAHPLTQPFSDDPIAEQIIDAYNAGLRACGAYDFDDLLLLAYRLLTEFPKVADLYRRLYGYICIDEAQDLNEAQYAVIKALCGDSFRNIMMVGDRRQSIYGFNTSDPRFMDQFQKDFGAKRVELSENFRSSQAVVAAAKALEPGYSIQGALPIVGRTALLVGRDEAHEATLVCDELGRLIADGHQDVEGQISLSRCAVLGRTRYTLLAIENEMKSRQISFFRRLSAAHENESDAFDDLVLALRVIANPKDRLHLASLAKRWGHDALAPAELSSPSETADFLAELSDNSPRCSAVMNAVRILTSQLAGQRLDLAAAIECMRRFGDNFDGEERRTIHSDAEILLGEWDQYLRGSNPQGRSLAGFMSAMALGSTRAMTGDSIALLTVHSSKGLEFDVVFIVGMADGVFPDYRSSNNRAAAEEERRNAFVAVTRSKRLLYFSYPEKRRMPWGDIWSARPSEYLRLLGAVR